MSDILIFFLLIYFMVALAAMIRLYQSAPASVWRIARLLISICGALFWPFTLAMTIE